MRILITNHAMQNRGGSELYTKELAIGLKKHGIGVSVFSPIVGEVAEELQDYDIPVYDDVCKIESEPNLIHGQHHIETMMAIMRFPKTPAIYLCHGIAPWQEMAPMHPNIVQYYAVSALISSYIESRNISPGKEVRIFNNWADIELFQRKSTIRNQPKQAFIVSNRYYDASPIKFACDRAGISLKFFGSGFGYSSKNLHDEFLNADIVFAVGKTAVEAMAAGCAVIPANGDGAAALVQRNNLDEYKKYNFALRLLQKENLSTDFIANEIAKYTAAEIGNVTDIVRNNQSLSNGISSWVRNYEEHINTDFFPKYAPADHISYLFQVEQLLALKERQVHELLAQTCNAQTELQKTQYLLQQAQSQLIRKILK